MSSRRVEVESSRSFDAMWNRLEQAVPWRWKASDSHTHGTVDTRTFDRGDYRYFADSSVGDRIGVLDRFPELGAFVNAWRERLARPVHVRVRLTDRLPEAPGLEAIELYRLNVPPPAPDDDEDTP